MKCRWERLNINDYEMMNLTIWSLENERIFFFFFFLLLPKVMSRFLKLSMLLRLGTYFCSGAVLDFCDICLHDFRYDDLYALIAM